MSESKLAPVPERRVQLLATWVAYGSAFVSFMVAGQTLTSRAREMYDSLSLELPFIAELPTAYPWGVALTFVGLGFLFLGLTRVRVRLGVLGAGGWIFVQGVALLSALVGVGLIYSSVLVFQKLQQALMQ
jgi:hypothetical protein